jgi:hypothetical protein
MGERGSITGLFTVLVEADDMNDPIADATRSILDGHIVLTRELATQNHYPAIDVLESVSRLTRDLLAPEHLQLSATARENMAIYRRNQDLITIGAYPAGSNAAIDEAIRLNDPLRAFLRQPVGAEGCEIMESFQLLAGRAGATGEDEMKKFRFSLQAFSPCSSSGSRRPWRLSDAQRQCQEAWDFNRQRVVSGAPAAQVDAGGTVLRSREGASGTPGGALRCAQQAVDSALGSAPRSPPVTRGGGQVSRASAGALQPRDRSARNKK